MKIFIAGDSTASIKAFDKQPETGWGEHLKAFIPSTYDVENFAKNGYSTKSFIAEGLLEKISLKIKKSDILIVQFGHNDSKPDLDRHADPDTDYIHNLEIFANTALNKGAIPIFISSITRRDFNEGILNPQTIADYPNAMKIFCVKHNYHFIDMYQISQTYLSKLGENKSKKLYLHLEKDESPNYANGVADNTHFNDDGAKRFASMIAKELKKYL